MFKQILKEFFVRIKWRISKDWALACWAVYSQREETLYKKAERCRFMAHHYSKEAQANKPCGLGSSKRYAEHRKSTANASRQANKARDFLQQAYRLQVKRQQIEDVHYKHFNM